LHTLNPCTQLPCSFHNQPSVQSTAPSYLLCNQLSYACWQGGRITNLNTGASLYTAAAAAAAA
jgi:hypothetical protein